jgi:hypothetical protein
MAASRFAMGVDRRGRPFRGFLPRKTTPRDLYQATVIAKLLQPSKKQGDQINYSEILSAFMKQRA